MLLSTSMFHYRESQKPNDTFIRQFREEYSDISSTRRDFDEQYARGAPTPGPVDARAPDHFHTMPWNDVRLETHRVGFPVSGTEEGTPENMHNLNVTPSWVEPGPCSIMPSANQQPDFHTLNSGGIGAIFHSQASDLHTPTAMHIMTQFPPSNTISGSKRPHSHGFEPLNEMLMANYMHGINPCTQQASYPPNSFIHRDSGSESMDDSADASSIKNIQFETASNMTASTDFSAQMTGDMSHARGEQFRFNVSLRAPTAMVNNLKEIPITYLNKGQTYNICVRDLNAPMKSSKPIRYRTCVRVSFEEEQRAKLSTCWQLWKDGQGTSAAHRRGGNLMAVEYVNPFQGDGEVHKNRQVHVENMSVDGVCVTWTANSATGTTDCNIPVRFNFLSTDFSHSKGVKGIPVRLCAKTELLSPGQESGVPRDTELAYCKVKLFRDHGAERKLANDVQHVKKTIQKLKQQVSHAEMGGGFAKRKRGNNTFATAKETDRPMKQSKHKRAWSKGSDDGPPEKTSCGDNLQSKLAMMQDIFSSTRPVSIFSLRGDQADDPDFYPIQLSGASESVKSENMDSKNTGDLQSAKWIIPSPSSTSAKLPKRPIPIQRIPSGGQVPRGFLEAVDIDSTYRPPLESPPKPIACFYVRFGTTDQSPKDYYRAVYLFERTTRHLMKQISAKEQIDPVHIVRVMRVYENGIRILVDDHMVRELPEGQDMVVDISEAPGADDEFAIEIELTY